MNKRKSSRPAATASRARRNAPAASSTAVSSSQVSTAYNRLDERFEFPLGKSNFTWLLGGLALILAGFLFMGLGGGDIYSFTRITLSVLLVVGGIFVEMYAIMKPKSGSSSQNIASPADPQGAAATDAP
jgi:predicted lipid-binding transport protein (Tim44 family)